MTQREIDEMAERIVNGTAPAVGTVSMIHPEVTHLVFSSYHEEGKWKPVQLGFTSEDNARVYCEQANIINPSPDGKRHYIVCAKSVDPAYRKEYEGIPFEENQFGKTWIILPTFKD